MFIYTKEDFARIRRTIKKRPFIAEPVYNRLKALGIYKPFRGRRKRRHGGNKTPFSKLSVGYFNAQSARNKDNEIADFITDHKLDICAITETWLSDEPKDDVSKGVMTPSGYKLQHVGRETRGGGIAIIHRGTLQGKQQKITKKKTFEVLETLLSTRRDAVRLCVVYRPPKSSISVFFKEIEDYIADHATSTGKFLLLGDFNIQMNCKTNSSAVKFKRLLVSLNLKQHVTFQTHKLGHTLDLVITRENDQFVNSIQAQAPLSDHVSLTFSCNITKPQAEKKKIQYRKLKNIDMDSFKEDLQKLPVLQLHSDDSNLLVQRYYKDLSSLLDRHAPLIQKEVYVREESPWYNSSLLESKRLKRKAERAWRKNPNNINRQILQIQKEKYLKLCQCSKIRYHQSLLEENRGDQKKLFQIANKLLYRQKEQSLPCNIDNKELSNKFVEFFAEKIKNITDTFNDITENIELSVLPKDMT